MAVPEALIADRYRLIRQLGAGGMGVVWEAHDERLDRPVAVKQLRPQPALTDAEADVVARRAMREARINARLQHPYAVSVFDVVEHQGRPCIVMELVPSVPLTEVMRELGPLDPSEAARVGSQIAAALAAAHALGIVHRDVKPGNVLIGDDGAAHICDFGISRAFGDTSLTMTGMITGTPAYLAPEAARGEESTFASDVYSLGATLYAAVEGEPPFGTEGNAIAVLYRVTAGEVRPPRRAGALGPLLESMMSTRGQDRPSMADAAAQLSALVDGRASSPRPSGTEPTLAMPAPVPERSSAPAPAPARSVADPPDTPARQTAIPNSPAPPQHRAAPTKRRRRRSGLVAAIAIAIVLAGAAAVTLLWPTQEQPAANSDPSPSATSTRSAEATSAEPTSTQPSATQSSKAPATQPTTAQLAQAVTDYYGLLPDNTDAGWDLLTASYQREAGGRKGYESFWNGIDTVTVTGVRATTPDRVQATLTYVEKSGDKSTERRSFRLVESGGVLKINQSSVI
ncbi:MAG: protein kinase [Microlunatus sp.]|nr:protein kinase [Microlunatus sp.]MDN5770437.1 protein kinase [Microlunatus sp.]